MTHGLWQCLSGVRLCAQTLYALMTLMPNAAIASSATCLFSHNSLAAEGQKQQLIVKEDFREAGLFWLCVLILLCTNRNNGTGQLKDLLGS